VSLTVFLILCVLATFALSITTFFQTLRFRRLPAIRWLLALTAIFFVGSFGMLMVLIEPTFERKVFFFYTRLLALVFLIPVWLQFLSAVFERWQWLNRPIVLAVLFAPCALNFLFLLHPATRTLLFTNLEPFSYSGISIVNFQLGSWYHVFYAWSSFLMVLSYLLSAVAFWHERGFRRRQVVILNLGFCYALVQSIYPFWLPQSDVLSWVATSSLSMLGTQLGILYAVVGQRLLNLVPLATAQIFQLFPDPVLVVDESARLMGANDRAISFFSLPRNFLGKRLSFLLPSLKLEAGEQILKDSQQKSHHFHLALKALGTPEKSPGTVLFFRDIAEQKNVELQLNAGLEFRARLLAFLAHDLTGFLENQAVLSLSLQSKLNLDPPAEVELLAHSALASRELVGNVMAWAKNQALQIQPVSSSFEWNLLLRETMDQMESRFKVKGVKAVFRSNQDKLVGTGDSEILAAAFRNFLSNALRATPAGKRVIVKLEAQKDLVQISVSDEGIGLAPAELEKIMEASRDFTLRGMPNAQGSGIGLMLARHFIAIHGGSFQMESNSGGGTEVLFSIPL